MHIAIAFLALILYSINPTILPIWLWTTFWVILSLSFIAHLIINNK